MTASSLARRQRPTLSFAFAGLASTFALAPIAQAVEFELANGEVTGTLDTTLSYGQVWRVQGQAKDNDAANGNDGNRNFDTGLASEVFKITSELEARYQDYGLFVRGSAFYDTQIMDKRSDYYNNAAFAEPSQNYPNNDRFTEDTRHTSGRSADILDAYLYGSWDVLGLPLSARVGRQVFNWGEGLFYRGVAVSNPLDAAKYRLPGSQVKEVIIPVEALSFNLGLTDSLNLEAYYQLKWQETAMDPVGSYYSTTDIFGAGGEAGYATVPALIPAIAAYDLASGLPGGLGTGPYDSTRYLDPATGTFKVGNVVADDEARDSGQFGIALHYIAESLNYTDFGFYFANYHTKEPVQQVEFGAYQGIDMATLGGIIGAPAAQALATLDLSQNAQVRRRYVEDVRMLGTSFSTTIGNASVFGELAYRPNLPIAITATNDIVGDLVAQGVAGVSSIYDGNIAGSAACAQVAGQQLCRSGHVANYERVEAFNASLGTIYLFGPTLGFDALVGVAEVATEQLHGSSLSYIGYAPTAERRKFAGTPDIAGETVDRESYGYTVTARGTWNNVYAGVNLSPFIVHSHDFKGNSHLTGSFMEGRKAYTFGVRADYLGRFEAGVQYTVFTGAGS
ncbi:MAG TPA: DUF1302 domain-containing protein, partial [Pseudomonas sp.]|nr:DUF1302 domain-containing protein [Pseudomonas sp.]